MPSINGPEQDEERRSNHVACTRWIVVRECLYLATETYNFYLTTLSVINHLLVYHLQEASAILHAGDLNSEMVSRWRAKLRNRGCAVRLWIIEYSSWFIHFD